MVNLDVFLIKLAFLIVVKRIKKKKKKLTAILMKVGNNGKRTLLYLNNLTIKITSLN